MPAHMLLKNIHCGTREPGLLSSPGREPAVSMHEQEPRAFG